ncbi:MRN complex-interacting protein [Erethizon dorsatum]
MATPQQSRVLRCCSCRLFQAHQVKRSLKWTCKACGEKQSFLRTYGEGSGADCRRHVQKLNLLQGQACELSLRSPEEVEGPAGPNWTRGGSSGGPQQPVCKAASGHEFSKLERLVPEVDRPCSSLPGAAQPSESRWLKYLDGVLHTQPAPGARSPEQPGPPHSQGRLRKRRRSLSTAQPPHGFDVQDSNDTEVTVESQDEPRLTGAVQQGSSPWLQSSVHCSTGEPGHLWRERLSPAPPITAPSSKWTQFLLSPGNSSQMDMEPLASIQRGPRPVSPAQAEPPREGHARPHGETPESSQAQGSQPAPPVRLCSLFTTGEDFDDDL